MNSQYLSKSENVELAAEIWKTADKSAVFAEISGWHRRQQRLEVGNPKVCFVEWYDDEGTHRAEFGSVMEARQHIASIDKFYGHVDIEDGYTSQRLKFTGGRFATQSGKHLANKDGWNQSD